jgi:hypothetical protein
MSAKKLPVRTVRGHINRAQSVYIWCCYTDDDAGLFPLEVSKNRAKELCDDADEQNIETMCVDVSGQDVYIGDVEVDETAETEETEEAPGGAEVEEEEEELA